MMPGRFVIAALLVAVVFAAAPMSAQFPADPAVRSGSTLPRNVFVSRRKGSAVEVVLVFPRKPRLENEPAGLMHYADTMLNTWSG